MGSADLSEVKGVVESWALPSIDQVPSWLSGSSAKAPIIANELMLDDTGKVLFLFWSKIGHWRACFLAYSLCLGSRMTDCLEGSV